MPEIIPWLFILPPAIVTIVAISALGWRYTPKGKARQLMGEGGRHLYRKEYDEAEACFRKGLELTPNHPGLTGTLASLLVSLERFEEAEPLVAKAIELQPKDMRLKLIKGRCQHGQDHVEEALKTWGSIPESADVYLDAQGIIASYHDDQGDTDKAIAILEAAATSEAGDALSKRELKRELRRLKKAKAGASKPASGEESAPSKPAAPKRTSRARSRTESAAE